MNQFKQIKTLLQQRNIDAAIFFRPEEMLMMLDYTPYWNGSILICFKDGKSVLFIPDIEPEDHLPSGNNELNIERYTWGSKPNNSRVWRDLENLILSLLPPKKSVTFIPSLSPVSVAINAAEGCALPEGFIQQLCHHHYQFIDAYDALLSYYQIKTPKQVDAIKFAHEMVSPIISDFFKLTPGMFDVDVVAQIESQITQLKRHANVFIAKGWAHVQTGIASANAGLFNKSSGHKIQSGDWVLLELAACINGYWLDITRTTVAGEPTSEQENLFDTLHKALWSSINHCQPYRPYHDVYYAAYDILQQHQLHQYFPHALGHGVGFKYHDPGICLYRNNNNQLTAGNVITIEPGLYSKALGGGLRIEENIVITEKGAELLSVAQHSIKG